MKIAVVSEAAQTNSGSRAPIELSRAFANLGHKVIFYAQDQLSSKITKTELENTGIKVRLIKSPKLILIKQIIAGLKLRKLLKEDKPDIISSHTRLALFLGSKLSDLKIASTYHGTQQDVWLDKIFPRGPNILDKLINKLLNLFIKSIMWTQLALSDKIITLSKYCSRELLIFYGKKAPFVYWGSVPPHLLKFAKSKTNKLGINLLSVSRIIPYKNFHILIRTIDSLNSQFSNLHLTIIGSHPNQKYLHYLEKIKPENVEIIVDASDRTLSKYYQQADIYVTADKFLFFGEPVLEAAAFGKPIVAFDFASAKELIIRNKIGYVVKNPEEFKKALETLIQSSQKRTVIGRNALKFAQSQTWEKCAKEYSYLFKKWLKE